MFSLDEEFLASLGLASMPAHEKVAFLRFLYEDLEQRVGEALSEGLSVEQMREFEAFIDRDMSEVSRWFEANAPDFATHDVFEKLLKIAPASASDEDVLCEYGALLWLRSSAPNYKAVVAEKLDELRLEITAHRDDLLEGKG